ncbi:MAG: Crp/Fnr family transcriptional regulator [Blastochloris sp.]|nr:Crp/Fnr family transcriptional regulator [Blastochloris sp.]
MRRQKERDPDIFGAWERLARGRDVESLPRGSVLYTPEQPADDLLLVCQGQVSLYLTDSGKRSLVLRVVEPGRLCGHVATAGEGLYDTFAETLTPARVCRIPRADIAALIAHDSDLALMLLEDLGQYRLLVSHQLDEVAFKSVPARLAALLLTMAGNGSDPFGLDIPRRSHRQLAEMINAYRETVTKVLNQFRAERLLEINRSTITLVNRSGLEELAQGW